MGLISIALSIISIINNNIALTKLIVDVGQKSWTKQWKEHPSWILYLNKRFSEKIELSENGNVWLSTYTDMSNFVASNLSWNGVLINELVKSQ